MQDSLRSANMDSMKSMSIIRRQISKGMTCTLLDCDQPLTIMNGPGANKLCREHQLYQREYGGMGRLDRPYTFHRNLTCDWCGYDPAEDNRCKDMQKKDALIFIRSVLIADHKIRRHDDGTDHRDNIQTLCLLCNAEKGVKNKDYLKNIAPPDANK